MREETVIRPPSKDNGLIYFRDSTALMVLYLVHYDTLLQNAADTTIKCDSYFITKCDKCLLQNALGCLLQSATVSLHNATVNTKCDVFITKCHCNYKM